ncbi:zincin-like metallopeptidase domain-containing protein [Acinetobacter sp. P1(2025)]|uniref:zincin-like metallopeptidase domain-containing protein n=1 Tax=Acinetobacter sp. P1(2025) TaxID=3446120 RepID=UPI003F53A801
MSKVSKTTAAKSSKTSATAKTAKAEKYLEEKKAIMDNMIAELEAKFATGKWVMPFGVARPHKNFVSGKAYKGLNIGSLMLANMISGSGCNEWITFLQAKELNWTMLAGSKGTLIEYWFRKHKKIEVDGKLVYPPKDEPMTPDNSYFAVKYSYVFNLECFVDQEGNPVWQPKESNNTLPTLAEQRDLCLEFAEKTQCKVFHDQQGRAFYRPSTHEVHMPPVSEFKTEEGYIATLCHELCHSTARDLRSDWKKNSFGSIDYAREECVAELGSIFCSSMLGIEKIALDSHAGYINGWLNVAKEDDPNFFAVAIKEASKIASHVWNTLYPESLDSLDDSVSETDEVELEVTE